MANPTEKMRDLDPTIIPAQPGYRVAVFGGPDDQVTEQTEPKDLWVNYEPLIAWIVIPQIRETTIGREVSYVAVYPVTPSGISDDDQYVVAPDGSWSLPCFRNFDSETDARRNFIATALRRAGWS